MGAIMIERAIELPGEHGQFALAMETKLPASQSRIAPEKWADALQLRQRDLRFDHRFIGGERCELGPGDVCYFPPDEMHVFTVTSATPVKVLVIYTPPYGESPDKVIRPKT